MLFFQFTNRRRYGDEVMGAAVPDWLQHRCHDANIRGIGHRMRRCAELYKAIHPAASRTGAKALVSREGPS